jgi:hypothetical protein
VPKPTITCEFESTSYVIDELVHSPTIVCSDGSDFDATAFATTDGLITAQEPDNWKTGGSTTYSTAGKSIYGVVGKCGGVEAEAASCTELTITATPIATCVFNPASYEAGQEIPSPEVKCTGGVTLGGTKTFSKVSGNDATGSANWADGGVATYATAGKSQYKVSDLKCNDIDVDDATCNEITITAPTITCKWSASYKGGEAIPAPAITCDNGKTAVATGASYEWQSGYKVTGAFPSTGPLATAPATGTYKVSDVTCGGYAAAEANCTLSITPSPTATCKWTTATKIVGESFGAPDVTCSNGAKSGTEIFSISGTATGSVNTTNWNALTAGKIIYKVSGVKCDGITVDEPICTELTIKPVPTATCAFSSASYNIGANVNSPTITCSDSTAADKTNAVFTKVGSGVDAKAPANWKATTNATTYYESNGTSQYKVSGVKCGTYSVAVAEANCTALTINPVTCTASGSYQIGTTIAPPSTPGCDSPKNLTYSPTSSNTVGQQAVTLTSVTCGSNNVAVTNLACGNVEIVTAPPCSFQQSWCPNMNWDTEIKWTESFSETKGACFFFKGNNNGNNAPTCNNNSSCNINKGDGGYYVYVINTPTYGISNDGGAQTKPNNCIGPVYVPPTITCSGITQSVPQYSTISTSNASISCSEGSEFTDVTFNTSSVGTFTNPIISGKCGGANVSGTCSGTITVIGGNSPIEINEQKGFLVPSNGIYPIKCSACNTQAKVTCKYTKNCPTSSPVSATVSNQAAVTIGSDCNTDNQGNGVELNILCDSSIKQVEFAGINSSYDLKCGCWW